MKIDNLIKTSSSNLKEVPVVDVEGYEVCPKCDSLVNCGKFWLANPEK